MHRCSTVVRSDAFALCIEHDGMCRKIDIRQLRFLNWFALHPIGQLRLRKSDLAGLARIVQIPRVSENLRRYAIRMVQPCCDY